MSALRRASPETLRRIRELREALRTYADRRGDRLDVRYRAEWIAFRSAAAGRAFAELRPGKNGFEVFLLPPRSALLDPRGLAMAVPATRGWGWFRSRAKVENGGSRGVEGLLRQSYEYARKMPGRRGRTRARRRNLK